MLDSKRIKAARALLEWTQKDLAKKSGLSLPAIANIERGAANPRKDSLDLLRQTFEQFGIEFLEPAGVQLVNEKFAFKVLTGRESQFQLWSDIARDFSDGKGGDLILSSVSDRPLVDRYPKETLAYLRRMNDLNVKRRILMCEGDNEIIGAQPEFYRQMPKILFAQTAYYIYKDKVALLMWELQKILLIENKNIADAFRTQFEYNWSISQPLTRHKQIL